jgi:hypothetical protein
MEGNSYIDKLMCPVLLAIKKHIKDSDAITEIYNRAYEALMEELDVATENDELNNRLRRLTNAIDDYLNDTREKKSIEALEKAMKDYGKQ